MTLSASTQIVSHQDDGSSLAVPAAAERGAPCGQIGPDDGAPGDTVVGAERDLLVVEDRFAIVPEWLLDADVSDVAVRLYAVLLRYGQTSGARMPSRRLLAQRLRKRSTDTVDRAMKELVAVGAVVVERRRRGPVNLTNRYVVRTAAPGASASKRSGAPGVLSGGAACSGMRGGGGGGGRRSAATPSQLSVPRTAATAGARAGVDGGGRISAARGSRISAARVAAGVRPDPEFLTQRKNPPPRPSTPSTAGGRGPRRSSELAERQRAAVLDVLGHPDLADMAARCHDLRAEVGLPARLWTESALLDVLADAVLERGMTASIAVPALLALAADPATRSPARLACPGPWWELPATGRTSDVADAAASNELALLEARLAEADGDRVRLQRLAREQLREERHPVTRLAVARRACALLPCNVARP
ncbi:hypothetical protein [Kineosporia sp. A_224]|uniref:hypothetical protein n=1 Tax=Kineosporia sp. A_224 TaxID=1962180 RepID=UPI001179B600|nr:hypothetical protein [Kineosporia sp. A_224]